MTQMILTTSGFVLPENTYYTPYAKDSDPLTLLNSLKSFTYANDALTDYFNANDVHNSSTSDVLYHAYRKSPTHDNFMAIVDYVCEIIGSIGFVEFVEAQIVNPHLAPVSLVMCKDLITDRFNEFQAYHRLSSNMRFTMNKGLTSGRASQLTDAFVKDVRDTMKAANMYCYSEHSHTWVEVLSKLMSKKSDFVAFFRYVFVHSY